MTWCANISTSIILHVCMCLCMECINNYITFVHHIMMQLKTHTHPNTTLEEVSVDDPRVAFSLLCQCAGGSANWPTMLLPAPHPHKPYAHHAPGTPPSQAIHPPCSPLEAFDHDIDIRTAFSKCTPADTSDQAWQQTEVSLCRGGLGIHSLSWRPPAAYIASLSSSGFGYFTQRHLTHAVELFNSLVPPSEIASMEEVLTSPIHQKVLSKKIGNHLFKSTTCISELFSLERLLLVSPPPPPPPPPPMLHLGCLSSPPRG